VHVTSSASVLLIDDDDTGLRLCRELLRLEGDRVRTAADAETALAAAELENFDAILSPLSRGWMHWTKGSTRN
jgi:CheY-like chemotaxis protein